MKKLHFLFIVVIAFILSACSKDDKDYGSGMPVDSVWHVDQTVKDYSSFKPGSYWIYQDSATSALDSVYVYNYRTGIDTNWRQPGELYGYFEFYEVYSKSALQGYNLDYWVNSSWTKNDHGISTVWFSRHKAGDSGGQTFLLFYPFVTGQQGGAYTENGITTCVSFFNSLTIDTVVHNNVVKFNNSENSAYHKSRTNFFIAKNIGIIRKEIIDSAQVWNLIRYNIVQ